MRCRAILRRCLNGLRRRREDAASLLSRTAGRLPSGTRDLLRTARAVTRTAAAALKSTARPHLRAVLVAAGLLATIWSSLSNTSHQLAYFNEAAGGPENGYKNLLNSNFDWEQDILLVREWIEAQGVSSTEVSVDTRSPGVARCLLSGKPSIDSTPQWVVTSSNRLFRPHQPNQKHPPTNAIHRIAYTIWILPTN